jgi:predicted membrane protein
MTHEWKYRRRLRHRHGPSSIWFGAILVGLGLVLLLDRLGMLQAREVLQYWPLLLVAGGLTMELKPVSFAARVWFGLVVVAGLLLLANNLGYLQIRGEVFWPLVLIGIGIVLLARAIESRSNPTRDQTDSEKPRDDFWSGPFVNSFDGRIRGSAVFSGIQRRVDAADFERAHVSAVFGGFELDLRPAGMKGAEAYVKAEAVFGGIEIRVPESWDVILRADSVFGGISDETRHPDSDGGTPAKRLIISGAAVFGGIVVTNKPHREWR